MKIFVDFEFTGLHPDTDFISMGVVAEDGRQFYAEVTPVPKAKFDSDQKWLEENVYPFLKFQYSPPIYQTRVSTTYISGSVEEIAEVFKKWLMPYGKVYVWSDCLTYDWIVMEHRLFGGNLPSNVFYLPFDIFPLFNAFGIDPDISREDFVGGGSGAKHNALWDAQIIKKCYEKLTKLCNSVGLTTFHS